MNATAASTACLTIASNACLQREPRSASAAATTLNRWPADASWNFVAVGRGHGLEFWVPFLRALSAIDPDMAVNIEHETPS